MSACEWDPIANQLLGEDEPSHAEATWSVGSSTDKNWHLCDACAARPRFKRFTARTRLRPAVEKGADG